jgi:O-antigen/teichoic acid export membrane protein
MDQESEILEEASEADPIRVGADQRVIVGQTGQNVVGLAVGAAATFAAQVLMSNRLGQEAFGVVTLATQFAFVAAAATRFGMDVANVRLVSILVGSARGGRARGLVRRSTWIAAVVSVGFGAVAFVLAPWLADRFSGRSDAVDAFRWAALAIPLAALAFTLMGATRGLKIMRYTLYAQWFAQPIGWIVFTLVLWGVVAVSAGWATAAFAASWGAALLIAGAGWLRERGRLGDVSGAPISEEGTGALIRFGALRAPGTLFSQLLFWTDLFVLSALMASLGPAGDVVTGTYGAVLRAGQSLFLFLTSVSLTFSPFVADLHHRGERDRLDALYKQVTRWSLAATIPVLLALAILPEQVMRIFGEGFVDGAEALRILIVGMIVPVMVGTVGFILIMAGRTGWDLLVYLAAFAIDVAIALTLARPEVLGIRGAAIAQAVTLTFSAVARLILVRRFLGIWPFERAYLRLLGPTVVGAGAMWGAHVLLHATPWLLNLMLSAAIGAGLYLVALIAVGLPANERAALGRLAAKATGRGRP